MVSKYAGRRGRERTVPYWPWWQRMASSMFVNNSTNHDDVIKWKHFPRYWPFVHKGQWRGALMFSLICVWINGWVNNREAGDLRRYRTHYDVIVMITNPIGPRGTKLSGICIKTQSFSPTKMHRKMSSAKCRPFSSGLSMFTAALSHSRPRGHYTLRSQYYSFRTIIFALWPFWLRCVNFNLSMDK